MPATGIPLLATINQIEGTAVLLAADAAIVLHMFAKPQWGIYLNGVAALVADNIIAVDFKNDWRIADYPQEEGAFQSYNKVLTPYDVKVTMTKGGAGLLSAIGIGSSANVKSFIAAVEMAAASLNLYDVMTPDRTYHSANITHYDYKRSAENGVSLLTVELWLQQIRVTATTAFTNTAAPDGMDPANTGSVQATTPPASQSDIETIKSFNQSTAGTGISPGQTAPGLLT